MTITRHEEWVQIAGLDEADHIRFTPEFQSLMADLGAQAKAFVGHLLGLWYDPFEHMLDYSLGDAKLSLDQPGEFDRNGLAETQDVVEYWAESWSKNDNCHESPQFGRHTLPQVLSRVRSSDGGSDYVCATRKSNACGAVAPWRRFWPCALLCAIFLGEDLPKPAHGPQNSTCAELRDDLRNPKLHQELNSGAPVRLFRRNA